MEIGCAWPIPGCIGTGHSQEPENETQWLQQGTELGLSLHEWKYIGLIKSINHKARN